MKLESFQDILKSLRLGSPITVEMGHRTLFYEEPDYFEQTPSGKKKISLEEAQGYLRVMVARWRREHRENRKKK